MKIHVDTFGCSSNQASSEIILGIIKSLGYEIVSEENADVIILNSCTVKSTTEQKILYKIKNLGEKGKYVIVTGCMPEVQLEDILQNNPEAYILGINSISRIGDILRAITNNKKKYYILDSNSNGLIKVPRVRFNPNIHISQLSQGCNNSCSYCIVKYARGPLKSFELNNIVQDIKQGLDEGCREIWLTSQDNAQYGIDINNTLPELLESICSLSGNFKIRIGMMNPFSIKPIMSELLDIFENEKIYKFLHLPIQSASNKVLQKMNRMHTIDEANDIIKKFKKRFDDCTLFTDIIVGFPGEENEDFMQTVKWVEEYKPEKINISRYTPRPHTLALKYPNIDPDIIIKRSNILHSVCENVKIEARKKMMNWQGEVFISKEAKIKGLMARTSSYKPVIIPTSSAMLGTFYNVKIYDYTPGYFIGKII